MQEDDEEIGTYKSNNRNKKMSTIFNRIQKVKKGTRIHRKFETRSFGAKILPVNCRARLT